MIYNVSRIAKLVPTSHMDNHGNTSDPSAGLVGGCKCKGSWHLTFKIFEGLQTSIHADHGPCRQLIPPMIHSVHTVITDRHEEKSVLKHVVDPIDPGTFGTRWFDQPDQMLGVGAVLIMQVRETPSGVRALAMP